MLLFFLLFLNYPSEKKREREKRKTMDIYHQGVFKVFYRFYLSKKTFISSKRKREEKNRLKKAKKKKENQ